MKRSLIPLLGVLVAAGCSANGPKKTRNQPARTPAKTAPGKAAPAKTAPAKTPAKRTPAKRTPAKARPKKPLPRLKPARRARRPRTIKTRRPKRPQANFRKAMQDFQLGDVIQAKLRRGGFVKGTIMALSERSMTLSSSTGKNAMVTNLRAKEVRNLRLVRRPLGGLKTRIGVAPRYPEESWLPLFSAAQILGKKAQELWTGRFQPNRPLRARRAFYLSALRFTHTSRQKSYFTPERPAEIHANEQIKLAGRTLAYKARAGKVEERCLGEIYLYLVHGKKKARLVCSQSPLPVSELSQDSLERFLSEEPVTCVVTRPKSRWPLKVRRISLSHARLYRRHLDRTADRLALRRMRARTQSRALQEAEARVREIYRAVGLNKQQDLDLPVIIRLELPAVSEGGLHLLPYTREVGLD